MRVAQQLTPALRAAGACWSPRTPRTQAVLDPGLGVCARVFDLCDTLGRSQCIACQQAVEKASVFFSRLEVFFSLQVQESRGLHHVWIQEDTVSL